MNLRDRTSSRSEGRQATAVKLTLEGALSQNSSRIWHFSSQGGSAVGRWETRKDPVVDLTKGEVPSHHDCANVKGVDASG